MQARASHDIRIRIQVQTADWTLSEKSQVLESSVLFDCSPAGLVLLPMIVFKWYSQLDYSNMMTPLTIQSSSDIRNKKMSESTLL